jgi:hypothetical protein
MKTIEQKLNMINRVKLTVEHLKRSSLDSILKYVKAYDEIVRAGKVSKINKAKAEVLEERYLEYNELNKEEDEEEEEYPETQEPIHVVELNDVVTENLPAAIPTEKSKVVELTVEETYLIQQRNLRLEQVKKLGITVIPQDYSLDKLDNIIPHYLSGSESLTGGGIAYDMMFNFYMMSTMKAVLLYACYAFVEKPLIYLMTGKTKNTQRNGNKVSDKLASILPKHTDEEMDLIEKTQTLKGIPVEERMSSVRKSYPTAFKSLNISMMRKIAYVSLEYLPRDVHKGVTQMLEKYGTTPSTIDVTSNSFTKGLAAKSIAIKTEQINSHKAESKHWKTQKFKNLFSVDMLEYTGLLTSSNKNGNNEVKEKEGGVGKKNSE